MNTADKALPQESTPRRARGRPRKTLDERDDGNRRRELLSAAARLFRQRGFAATSTRDIAAAAGMQAGSPFYHFENKQALLAAVMQAGMRSALERQNAALARLGEGATAQARLQALVRNHFEVLLGPDSDFIPVMLYEWRALDTAAGNRDQGAQRCVRSGLGAGARQSARRAAVVWRADLGAADDFWRPELDCAVVPAAQGGGKRRRASCRPRGSR